MNSNYAIDNGLNPVKDSIAIEDKSSPFANILAVKEGHKNDEKFQELLKVLQSKEMKKYIKDEYGDNLKVISTGGLGRIIFNETDLIDVYDPDLTFKGLKIIYDKYKKTKIK